jgi:hypothetical protein
MMFVLFQLFHGSIRDNSINIYSLFSYARVYCIHIHNARRELVFYQLAKEGVVKRLSIHLHAQGTVFLHTIDNLLITHHVEQKVLFFVFIF